MAMIQSGVKVGEKIQHFTHPQHPLTLISPPYPFTCKGCQENGAGPRYRCNKCNFDIHEFCAKAPATVWHPYHTQHQLIFHSKPPGGLMKSKCEVCGKDAKGFAFRCSACYFCLHPCCSQLPQELKFRAHPQHSLKLLEGSPCRQGAPYTCNMCGKKGDTWVYHCAPCDFYLHALCAKTAQGIKIPPKPSRANRAGRYASQVIKIFVDGLVEGLGEGVGDVILDSISHQVNDDHKDGEVARICRAL